MLVHGLAGSSRWWREVEQRLGGLDVHPVDLPRTAGLEEAERWLVEQLEPGSNLVGHSFGGLLAARVAGRRPELVRRLVLIAPAGIPHRSLLGHALPLVQALARTQPRLAGRLLGDALRAGPLRLVGEARAAAGADVRPDLAGIEAPTLLVWGERDRLVPVDRAQQWSAALGDARLELLPRTGHVPMVERPDEVSRLLREFLLEPA